MIRPIAVLRPEPGNAATVARVIAAGMMPIALPLFAVRPLAWTPPDPHAFDALLLTSANAVRHAGEGLSALAGLPVVAVGAATAAAARAAGLTVAATGDGGVEAALTAARAAGLPRLLHLAGRERQPAADAKAIAVYASEPVAVPANALAPLAGSVALLHSARAAARLAALVPAGEARAAMRVAALSPAVLAAAGAGWAAAEASRAPDEARLIALAAAMARAEAGAGTIDPPGHEGDKTA